MCVPINKVCDEHPDCPGGTDEGNSTAHLTCGKLLISMLLTVLIHFYVMMMCCQTVHISKFPNKPNSLSQSIY